MQVNNRTKLGFGLSFAQFCEPEMHTFPLQRPHSRNPSVFGHVIAPAAVEKLMFFA
jgi:hypothetical protein